MSTKAIAEDIVDTPEVEATAPEATTEVVKNTSNVKTIKLACKYAQVRIGTEYFTPDHEGEITVPATLATEAKKVLGL